MLFYGFVSSNTYEKRDDFDFDIVNFPFLDGDVPRRAFMVYTFRNLLGMAHAFLINMFTALKGSQF